jgi:hypothetical protein
VVVALNRWWVNKGGHNSGGALVLYMTYVLPAEQFIGRQNKQIQDMITVADNESLRLIGWVILFIPNLGVNNSNVLFYASHCSL